MPHLIFYIAIVQFQHWASITRINLLRGTTCVMKFFRYHNYYGYYGHKNMHVRCKLQSGCMQSSVHDVQDVSDIPHISVVLCIWPAAACRRRGFHNLHIKSCL